MTNGLSKDAAREAAARAGLAGAREANAEGPGADAEALRRAYLDLLKLCLTDLTGSSTVSVGAMPDGTVVSRELSGYQLRLRSAGMDWPLTGLTMTGLARLDDLQRCVESVVRDGVAGDLIEAGAWRGGASMLMRAALDSLGESERMVWVADSFQGFPEHADGADGATLSAYDFLAVSVDEVKASFERLGLGAGVRFVPGFFQDTLPGLRDGRWAIVRLDGDTYEATRVALESLYAGLAPGGYLIVDDYGAFDECRQAIDEFRAENGIDDPIEAVDWTCVRWRKGAGADSVDPERSGTPAAHVQSAAQRRPPIRTQRELALESELEALRGRIANGGSAAPAPPVRRALARVRAMLGAKS